MEFIYKIKGRNSKTGDWSWPPLWTDKIEANDIKDARKKILDIYDNDPRLVAKAKKGDVNSLLLTIKNFDKEYGKHWFFQNECIQCHAKFTLISKYQMEDPCHTSTFCSIQCQEQHEKENMENYIFNKETYGIHKPVIYKITNKITDRCYIGKTTQAFTLRWYQHFFQSGSDNKFYQEIGKYKLTDWVFEVIEEINEYPSDCKDNNNYVLQRELFYITKYDSVSNGYNTLLNNGAREEHRELFD